MPAAARKGDSGVVHCSGFNIASGSGDVFINGQSAARKGDTSSAHKRPGSPCPTHTSSIAGGSSSVFINGRAAARVGDAFAGCTSVSSGSGDVFIGG
jgi:uncharacterized Zn-binding protein involved in type VI secretion